MAKDRPFVGTLGFALLQSGLTPSATGPQSKEFASNNCQKGTLYHGVLGEVLRIFYLGPGERFRWTRERVKTKTKLRGESGGPTPEFSSDTEKKLWRQPRPNSAARAEKNVENPRETKKTIKTGTIKTHLSSLVP